MAVLGFKNLSGNPEAAWLSTALSEMLSTELAAGERLRTVSGENVSRMKRDLALTDTGSYAKDTLERIRLNLSSDVVVFGTYVVVPDRAGAKIRIDLRVQDTANGDTSRPSVRLAANPTCSMWFPGRAQSCEAHWECHNSLQKTRAM